MALTTRYVPRQVHGFASQAVDGACARLLYVDDTPARSARYREALEIAGFPPAEDVGSGDEALDLMGARAQRFDAVIAWLPLADAAMVDFFGILRRCASPVRLLGLTTLTPPTYPLAARLAGLCGMEGTRGERGFVTGLRAVLASGASVAEIVAARRVPETLRRNWALRIYGVEPGAWFDAALD